jgi:hypothetical protein
MIMYCLFLQARGTPMAHAQSQFHVSNSEAETATAADEYIDRRAGFSRCP